MIGLYYLIEVLLEWFLLVFPLELVVQVLAVAVAQDLVQVQQELTMETVHPGRLLTSIQEDMILYGILQSSEPELTFKQLTEYTEMSYGHMSRPTIQPGWLLTSIMEVDLVNQVYCSL